MQLIAEQQSYKNSLIELYYFNANQTQKYWNRDKQAALRIQSNYRMFIKRKEFKKKKAAAIKIQTVYRVFHAVKTFKIKKLQDENQKNLSYFDQQAIVIQKMFRGFFVRKYLHDFYLRKQELKALEAKNQQFLEELQAFGQAQKIENQQYLKKQAKAEFSSLAKNLHHLSSTKGIPGVYNSPFAMQKPAVFDKTVEQHLSHQFKSSYKWRPPRKEDPLRQSIRVVHRQK